MSNCILDALVVEFLVLLQCVSSHKYSMFNRAPLDGSVWYNCGLTVSLFFYLNNAELPVIIRWDGYHHSMRPSWVQIMANTPH
uniref:Putative secreted protein n=1 Tax=Anopheles darlingi TaxID=43151 RepID=A0A2M4DBF9_ANODA